MCTVSYLPLDKGYIITSNRDESPDRAVDVMSKAEINGQNVWFPKDPGAGGSWFAFSDAGDCACLLNGAFEPFDPTLKFEFSRGLVLLESFRYRDISKFADQFDFSRTAPFTLVLTRGELLHQVIWDGHVSHYTLLDSTTTHFWSSVTLYPESVRKWRKNLFDAWLSEHKNYDQQEIMSFHQFGSGTDTHDGFVMNRDEIVKTLSISSVAHNGGKSKFHHQDLIEVSKSFYKLVEQKDTIAEPS